MASVSKPSIVLERVTKVYGAHTTDSAGEIDGDPGESLGRKAAVNDVSLRLDEGSRLGIIGRNGAGKSTLLHMIAGLAEPTSGRIQVSGKVTSVMTIGVGVREDLSGRENIYVDGQIHGKSRAEVDTIVDEVIEFAELGRFIDLPVRTYSTGMKARLAFSMISHLDPEILIIDEALGAGDAKFAAKASRKIEEICDRGKIVIIVSHSMGAIQQMCNLCIWMDQGNIVRMGSPDEVTNAYLDTVHKEDEAALLARFRGLVGGRSHLGGWEVRRLEVAGEGSGSAVLESGEDARIRASLVMPGAVATPRVRLSIQRLDGLLLADEVKPLDPCQATQDVRELTLEVGMSPVVFGPGTYRAGLQMLSGDMLAAERHTVFEVFTRRVLIGGMPAFICPVRMRSQMRPRLDSTPSVVERESELQPNGMDR